VPADDALAWGLVGPIARAAGVDYDVRRYFPYCGYETYDFEVPTERESDQHFLIYSQGFTVPAGDAYVPVEGPRGEHGVYIVSDGTNRPWRIKMRAPSLFAIQALPKIVEGGLIADVVAVIGSTDVVMGDCDR
jgi:NADH-quinone oxidoreductase subunit D